MEPLETTLVHPDPAKPRYYHLRLDGGQLISRAWTGTNAGRRTVRDLGDIGESSSIDAFTRQRDQKMRKGFCYRADIETASRGDVVLELLGLDHTGGDTFDLSPDGRCLVFGRVFDKGYGAEILVVDIDTGHRRVVHSIPTGWGGTSLHAVLFHPDGWQIVYAANDQTLLLDPLTRRETVVADYTGRRETHFNPFLLRPVWSRDRRRLLVFDSGNRVKVVDPELATVFEIVVPLSEFECRAAALSPSGRLLALSLSRGNVYSSTNPAETHLEVWDIGTGELQKRFPIERPADRIGFDPTEELLITKPVMGDGPMAFRIDTGSMAWQFDGRWDVCYGWDYSPVGTDLAIGRERYTELVHTRTREKDPAFGFRRPAISHMGRVSGVKISSDGRLLATGGDYGRILVHRL